MKRATYPFAAVVGQDEMKLALMLAAVDWRLGVLLRGDKGSGKTTTARGLASLLPAPAPFINLPIGATEDRLLGGLHIERAIKGDPVLKPGLLAEAHGGVLYIDEVNLLPAHLGDAILDAAASGINVVEREGLSAAHPAEFVLLGSMNPEEGSLRPQLLDRFALSVTLEASLDPAERRAIIERRMAFDRDVDGFAAAWSTEEAKLQASIATAREVHRTIECPPEILEHISTLICEHGIRSLRADLAVMRAAIACAALQGDSAVEARHVEAVLHLALAHRRRDPHRPSSPPSTPPAQPQPEIKEQPSANNEMRSSGERVFSPRAVDAPKLKSEAKSKNTGSVSGTIIGSRRSETPGEFDLRATLTHALAETGTLTLRTADLHERVRAPIAGTRYLLVIDSSGSHAVRERMRQVKGAAIHLLNRSFQPGDEVAVIVFRGTAAEAVLEPTTNLADATTALEYLPTGGRTPLAHGLTLAASYLTDKTILILITDGRANFPMFGDDAWEDALAAAAALETPSLVVNTETSESPGGHAVLLAQALRGQCISLDQLPNIADLAMQVQVLK